jgi:hypothetical protein
MAELAGFVAMASVVLAVVLCSLVVFQLMDRL